MARQRITVTQLKCAVLDPDWRGRWLAGETLSTCAFKSNGSSAVYGTRFHQETEQLAKWLVSPANLDKAAAINSADDLLDVAWRASLQGFTDALFADGKADEAALFTARMRHFCERLIALKTRTAAFENWQDVFVATEESIDGIRVPVGDATIEIGARVDAIRFHPQHHLEVVDYKLSQGVQQKSDLVQLAIYAHIIPLWRSGCQLCGTLEYYLPEFMEVNVSTQELADIYANMVDPVLHEMFARHTTPQLSAAAEKKVPTTPALAKRITAAYAAFGLTVEAADIVEGPQVTRIKLVPGPGVKVASLANRAEDLQVSLALDEPPLIKPGRGFVMIDLPRPDRHAIPLSDFFRGAVASRSPMVFPIGIGIEGEAILADFCDSNTCHALVAGTSGSGKSEWLKTLVASLAHRNPPTHVRFALVNPKILTFGGVAASPYLWQPIATDLASACAVLDAAVTEMEGRYLALAKQGFTNLGDRFQAGLFDLPFLVLVFDEFADLVLTGRAEKREFEESVARLAGKGRAAGIHLVLATQRPDRTVVTGLIKSNLPMKVCLRVTSATNSQIVLDEPGAESLLGKGDLLCDFGRGVIRAQSYYVLQAEFARALRAS